MKSRTLIADTQKALGEALRRSPDGDFVPLVVSVLDRAAGPEGGTSPAWRGVTADLLADRAFQCWVTSEECRLKHLPKEFERKFTKRKFTKAVHATIRDYWDYVATLD